MSDATDAEFPRESDERGRWVRQESPFRNRVTADGSSGFPAAAGRYHLYVSWACPWAHRTILFRRFEGLEEAIGMTVVDPIRDEKGWRFREGEDHGKDEVEGFNFLAEAYAATDPAFDGRVTVPVLWDTDRKTIVNNESAEIIRMLNVEFDEWANPEAPDFYPEELREEIDAVNDRVYRHVNDGVYQTGFATTQAAYDEAFDALFEALDWLDARLEGARWLVGNRQTEADWRLFTTLIRFDTVYHTHFKCNLRRIVDYPSLWPYLRDLYQQPGVAATVNFDHIKRHYYGTHRTLNPKGIVPKGPALDLDAAHDRASLGPAGAVAGSSALGAFGR
ncbi:MAG: glutathione S-transferase family protein [Gemmatimonadetes bacterium]|nr:glutathione S-transferase family protein [Gemmatimonadota bacterium]